MTAAASALAQERTADQSQCRSLADAGNFVGPDEVLVNGMVCKVSKPAPSQTAPMAEKAATPTPSGPQGEAKIYFYRKEALLPWAETAFIDEFEVCRVTPEKFCVVVVKSGGHGIGQTPSTSQDVSGQRRYTIDSELEYYFAFAPNRWAELGCGLLGGSCIDSGWKPIPVERGREEIKNLKQEEIAVSPGPPNSLPRRSLFGYVADFETIGLRLGDRVEASFIYALTNYADPEYRLPEESSALLVTQTKVGGWARNEQYHVQYPRPLSVPKGQTIRLTISAAYEYSEKLRKGEEPNPGKITAFLRQKIDGVDGFLLFDVNRRFDMFLPGGWRFKTSEVYARPPQFFSDIRPELRSCLEKIDIIDQAALPGSAGDKAEQWNTCFSR